MRRERVVAAAIAGFCLLVPRVTVSGGVLTDTTRERMARDEHGGIRDVTLEIGEEDPCSRPASLQNLLGASAGAAVGYSLMLGVLVSGDPLWGPEFRRFLVGTTCAAGAAAGLGTIMGKEVCPRLIPYAVSGGIVGAWAAVTLLSNLDAQAESQSWWLPGGKLTLPATFVGLVLPTAFGAVFGRELGVQQLALSESERDQHPWTVASLGGRTWCPGWPRGQPGPLWGAAVGKRFPIGRNTILRQEIRYVSRAATLPYLAVGYGWGSGVRQGDWHMDFRSLQISLLLQRECTLSRHVLLAVAAGGVFSGTIEDKHSASDVKDYPRDVQGVDVPPSTCSLEGEAEDLLSKYSGMELEARVGLWGERFFLEGIWNVPLYKMAPDAYSRGCARRYRSLGLSVGVRF